jgi:hypothetical protein
MPSTRSPIRPTPDVEDGGDPAMLPPTDDELLALVLIATWASRTGRLLPIGVPPADLTQQELIAFWADDQIPTSAPPRLIYPATTPSDHRTPCTGSTCSLL